MIPVAVIRSYAVGAQVEADVAGQDIVLHYALALLHEAGLIGRDAQGGAGPLLFKGGTALRKCVFGSTGRFSEDIDLDATHENGFEAQIEAELQKRSPYHEINFEIAAFRYSKEGNFSATVGYRHPHGTGSFELQISYRLEPILAPRDLPLAEQPYFSRLECGTPLLCGLDPYEMIGEKIIACNRRLGGSAKDIYDLNLWAGRPFEERLVRRLAVLKAWTDRRERPRYEPVTLLDAIQPKSFRWTELQGLVPRRLQQDRERICSVVRDRFAMLAECSDAERTLLSDQVSHREHALYRELRDEARRWADALAR
ncbi:MAG: nucleotidyl transferase AbiEii/AbiGii toxin family protein [Solirubrobacteraceae bacterium]